MTVLLLPKIYIRLSRNDQKSPSSRRDIRVMFTINLQRADHTKRYSISTLGESGWEVRLEEDRELKHHAWYHDWHRVERVMAEFRREVGELTSSGWAVRETGR